MRLDGTYYHNFPSSLLSNFNHFVQVTAKGSVFKYELEKTRVLENVELEYLPCKVGC